MRLSALALALCMPGGCDRGLQPGRVLSVGESYATVWVGGYVLTCEAGTRRFARAGASWDELAEFPLSEGGYLGEEWRPPGTCDVVECVRMDSAHVSLIRYTDTGERRAGRRSYAEGTFRVLAPSRVEGEVRALIPAYEGPGCERRREVDVVIDPERGADG